jgi:hypothetical protein
MTNQSATKGTFTNKNFFHFLGFFTNDSNGKNIQMSHFWRWAKAQEGVKREYTYLDFGQEITETLTLKGIEIDKDGHIVVLLRTKTGKKDWVYDLLSSPFFSHYEKRNRDAGTWKV